MKLKIFFSVLAACILLFTYSCKKDEVVPESDTPVLGTDFNFTVNANTVTFTTTLVGNVWFKNEATSIEYPAVAGTVDVFISTAGVYSFTCNTLVEGAPEASLPFDVEILQDDLGFLNSELWINLAGGLNQTKTWTMDMSSTGKCVYFDGPVFFSGEEGDPYWSWDVLDSDLPYTTQSATVWDQYFNWSPEYATNNWLMAAQDYGTITFSGNDGVAGTSKFGTAETGSFTFDTATMKIVLSGVTLPIDTGRVNEGQYEDLANIRIYSLSDSAMQLGLKRAFEGGEESKWTMIYNFICDDYVYPVTESFTFEEAVETSFTAADLVGTWKYEDVPMGWIAWTKVGDLGTTVPAHLFEKWDTRAQVVTTLESWGAASVDSTFTAHDVNEYIFNGDGTCTLAGVANTYTVDAGVITFGTELTAGTEFSQVWLDLVGTEIKVLDFSKYGPEDDLSDHSYPGVWIGQKNGDKTEYSAVQIIKQ